MWTQAGKMGAALGFHCPGDSRRGITAPSFHTVSVSHPPATLGVSVRKSHIHIPYYCLEKSNQEEEA